MLELIERRPDGAPKATPLVFVHGAWHAAWCWDEHFLPYFASNGYACTAVSLRGHGSSPGRERLRWTRVRDYVDDVTEVVAGLPAPPVLVGHSAGGFVVQKCLEQHTAAGAVLVASLPPRGAAMTALRVLRRHPGTFLKANLRLSLAPILETPELAQEFLFPPSMPKDQVVAYWQRLQDESYRAFLDLIALDLVRTTRVSHAPMLVLAGGRDALVAPDQGRRTAKIYGADLEILPDMAHDIMLDRAWRSAAERMVEWLDRRVP